MCSLITCCDEFLKTTAHIAVEKAAVAQHDYKLRKRAPRLKPVLFCEGSEALLNLNSQLDECEIRIGAPRGVCGWRCLKPDGYRRLLRYLPGRSLEVAKLNLPTARKLGTLNHS